MSLLEPSLLIAGRFNSETMNNGNVEKCTISTPAIIPGAENLMYEPSEYDYENDDDISE